MRLRLGGGMCSAHPLCDSSFEVIVDDGLGARSTADTLRAEAKRVWRAGGWHCGRCGASYPETEAVLDEWLERELERRRLK